MTKRLSWLKGLVNKGVVGLWPVKVSNCFYSSHLPIRLLST